MKSLKTVQAVRGDILGPVSQTQPLPGREAEMHKNDAGGYVFTTSDLNTLRRFLMLGSESNHYVAGAEQAKRSCAVLDKMIAAGKTADVVSLILDVSMGGLAPTNEYALFALAYVAAKAGKDNYLAYIALNKVARTASHLFSFVAYSRQLRGWGRGLRKAVARWYETKTPESLAYQMVKYRTRDGWSHADVLRCVHPVADSRARNALYKYAVDGMSTDIVDLLPKMIAGYETAKEVENAEALVKLIVEYGLTFEMVPNQYLRNVEVWRALLLNTQYIALVRNLGRISSLGMMADNKVCDYILGRLTDAKEIEKSRVHPFNLYIAQAVYKVGHGDKGSLTWRVDPDIVKALDVAIKLAFKNATPVGKKILIAVDMSGSMSAEVFNGEKFGNLRTAEAALVLATIWANTEPKYAVDFLGFSSGRSTYGNAALLDKVLIQNATRVLPLVQGTKFSEAIAEFSRTPGAGGTDCSLPFMYAIDKRDDVVYDGIVILTDGETWAGSGHPEQLLQHYRKTANKDCRFINIALATNKGQLTGDDPLTMQVVGFDASLFEIANSFLRGEL